MPAPPVLFDVIDPMLGAGCLCGDGPLRESSALISIGPIFRRSAAAVL